MAASFFHSSIQMNVGHQLAANESYRVCSELTISINGTDYKPDLCLYPYQKVDWIFDSIRMEEIPLMVVEILSPTQGAQELIEKMKIFLEAGVKSCWLVTVHPPSVSVFSSISERKIYTDGDIVDNQLGITIPFESVFV